MKAILFDFGNVLGRFRHQKACERLTKYTNVSTEQLYIELCIGVNATRRQVGLLSPEAFYAEVCQLYQLDEACSFKMFSSIWGDIFSEAPSSIAESVSNINPKVARCIASNTEALHWPYIEPLAIVQLFHKELIFRSYEIGHEKPSEAFFLHIIDTLSIDPVDILFIDDLSENVESFKRIGGQGEVFDLRFDAATKLSSILKKYGAL